MPRVRSPYGAERCILFCVCVCERVGVELCSLCVLSHSQRARFPSLHALCPRCVYYTAPLPHRHRGHKAMLDREANGAVARAPSQASGERVRGVCAIVCARSRGARRGAHRDTIRPFRPSISRRPSASPHARTVLFTEPWPPPRPASRSPRPQCRGSTSTATAAIATARRPMAHSASRRR